MGYSVVLHITLVKHGLSRPAGQRTGAAALYIMQTPRGGVCRHAVSAVYSKRQRMKSPVDATRRSCLDRDVETRLTRMLKSWLTAPRPAR